MFLCLALFLTVGFVVGLPAKADWINLTGAETSPNIAEIYVLDDHIKLVLEIFIEDLRTFDDLCDIGPMLCTQSQFHLTMSVT